jgi:uncharacterized protein YgbK (DUF1537 family)
VVQQPQLIILADDLTGAADCAARAVGAGHSAAICVEPEQAAPAATVLAFTSDSRHLPPGQAAQRVSALARQLAPWGNAAWYKKIDSTLRGNLGAEIVALLGSLGRSHALLVPAFPAQGRGLHGGMLVAPALVGTTHLPTLLRHTTSQPSAAIPLALVRAGVTTLAEQLYLASTAARLIVIDALTDADLRTIGEAARQALPHALPCGSAGLLGVLAAQLTAPPDLLPYQGLEQPPIRSLFIVGSASPQAHRQIASLRLRRPVAVALLDQPLYAPAEHSVLLHLPLPQGLHTLAEGRATAAQLASYARQWATHYQPQLLVLVGGDTAISVLNALGVGQLVVLRELLPGVALCRANAAEGVEYLVVLKAGSHGDDHALVSILQAIEEEHYVNIIPTAPRNHAW